MNNPPPCSHFDPTLFDSTGMREHLIARNVCAACPMLTECLQRAISIAGEHPHDFGCGGPDGTWGGLLWINGRIVTELRQEMAA